MKKLIATSLILCSAFAFAQKKADSKPQSKKEQDRQAILSLAGSHKVSFDFAETFAPSKEYKYHDRYHEVAIEYVAVAENSENKIVLQHLLVIGKDIIIKHWRQDWEFENTEFWNYDKDDRWTKVTLKPEQVKGQWTQKVYQVDDGPRYMGSATWVHVDGKHTWESTADSPLPRREHTKRSDYNVLKRHNRIIITENGWLHEQDNEKILRQNGKDSLLCLEKGLERFTNIADIECEPGIKWWDEHKAFCKDLRTVWADISKTHNVIWLEKSVDEQKLYEAIFDLAKQQVKANASSEENQVAIRKVLEKFLKA